MSNATPENMQPDNIINVDFDEELKTSYFNYAMAVITDRALPDARDGLKPVQRRILHAMKDLGLSFSGGYKKSARVVGETMGKYHPHGDSSIYEAMARMAQSFSMRVPLVAGQGNFGSLDGDAPAAMRYTEAKMSSEGECMHIDINENAVDFIPNFDDSLTEPSVLPSALPNLLINGSQGIAVGMATNIPPHNPVEILDLLSSYVEDGCDWSCEKLADDLQGPDFPTGGEIVGKSGVKEMYLTGRGKFILQGRSHVETTKNRKMLVITEIPYGISKSRLVEQISEKLSEGMIDGIVDLRDESDRNGDRIVVVMHTRTDPKMVESYLRSNTSLSTSFGGNIVALEDGKPATMSLKNLFDAFIGHRRVIVERRTRFRLARDEARLHIVEGLLKALDILDEVVATIRKSSSPKEAKETLMNSFGFTQPQTEAILEMRLSRLTGLEKSTLEKEEKKLHSAINEWNAILGSKKRLDKVLIGEFQSMSETFKKSPSSARRTSIIEEAVTEKRRGESPGQISVRFTEPVSPCIVFIDEEGNIRKRDMKRRPSVLDDGVWLSNGIIYAVSFDGKFHSRERSGIPDFTSKKIVSASSFFGLPDGMPLKLISPDEHEEVLFIFKDGTLKRTSVETMKGSSSRKNTSKSVASLSDNELLFDLFPIEKEFSFDVVLTASSGKTLRINKEKIPLKGNASGGVAGINIVEDDSFSSVLILPSSGDDDLFCVGVVEGSLLFRFPFSSLKTTGRGGKGLYIHRGDKYGSLQKIFAARQNDVFACGEFALPVSEIPPRDIAEHAKSTLFSIEGKIPSIEMLKICRVSSKSKSAQDEDVESLPDENCEGDNNSNDADETRIEEDDRE